MLALDTPTLPPATATNTLILGGDRLLIVNLGKDLHLGSTPEPLLAPMADSGWRACWCSEAPEYGGSGTVPCETKAGWILPAKCAAYFVPDENCELPDAPAGPKN